MKGYVSPILERIRNADISGDLQAAHDFSKQYIDGVDGMSVYPSETDIAALNVFDEELNENPVSTAEILEQLHRYGSKGTVAQTGRRYFGFVCGGILPAALCSKWITDAWDQNPAMFVLSPTSAVLEKVCEKWLKDLLKLPDDTVAGFVSGSSTATTCALIAARNHLLGQLGHDAAADGLAGAEQIKVIIGAQAHSTVYKAISIAGLGYGNITVAPVDEQGRVVASSFPEMDNKTLVVLQAGNVNSGSFDEFEPICQKAREAGAWVHVDGAFGLWAAASTKLAHLTQGMQLADSWSVDGHKTLNAPYDNGIVLCRSKEALIQSMHMTGSYIQLSGDKRDSMMYTMEMSRRARAADLWAVLKSLGKQGVAELVEELNAKAVYFAEGLKEKGFEILNDVVFNQVVVHYIDDQKTEKLIADIQKSGVLWLGGSKWRGKTVMRISVCSYKTTYEDVDTCVEEMFRLSK